MHNRGVYEALKLHLSITFLRYRKLIDLGCVPLELLGHYLENSTETQNKLRQLGTLYRKPLQFRYIFFPDAFGSSALCVWRNRVAELFSPLEVR